MLRGFQGRRRGLLRAALGPSPQQVSSLEMSGGSSTCHTGVPSPGGTLPLCREPGERSVKAAVLRVGASALSPACGWGALSLCLSQRGCRGNKQPSPAAPTAAVPSQLWRLSPGPSPFPERSGSGWRWTPRTWPSLCTGPRVVLLSSSHRDTSQPGAGPPQQSQPSHLFTVPVTSELLRVTTSAFEFGGTQFSPEQPSEASESPSVTWGQW